MRPSTRRPDRPVRALALHAAGACAVGAWAALLFTIACAPDVIDGPSGPPAGAVAEAPPAEPVLDPPPLAACEDLRFPRLAVREMTGVDPLCVAPDQQPIVWREHFAPRVPDGCGCGDHLDP